MKKNSSHKTLSIVKRISITNIGIFIIACILSIVATLKLNVEYHIDRDAQMMKVYISNTLSSIDNTLKDMGRVSPTTSPSAISTGHVFSAMER